MLAEKMPDEKTANQWDKAFSQANTWYSIAQSLGEGFLLYLPLDRSFSNNW